MRKKNSWVSSAQRWWFRKREEMTVLRGCVGLHNEKQRTENGTLGDATGGCIQGRESVITSDAEGARWQVALRLTDHCSKEPYKVFHPDRRSFENKRKQKTHITIITSRICTALCSLFIKPFTNKPLIDLTDRVISTVYSTQNSPMRIQKIQSKHSLLCTWRYSTGYLVLSFFSSIRD